MILLTEQEIDKNSRAFAESVVNFSNALKLIADAISLKVRKILIAHYYAPFRRLSIAEMSGVAGYKSPRAASLPFGIFAAKLALAMKQPAPGFDNLSTIGIWDPSADARGHGGWIMYDDLACALEDLTWVKPESEFSATGERFLLPGTEKAGISNLRVDIHNGLLLTPNLDCLFDKYLITFDATGQIRIAPTLSEEALQALGIHAGMKLKKMNRQHLKYLARHMEKFELLCKC